MLKRHDLVVIVESDVSPSIRFLSKRPETVDGIVELAHLLLLLGIEAVCRERKTVVVLGLPLKPVYDITHLALSHAVVALGRLRAVTRSGTLRDRQSVAVGTETSEGGGHLEIRQ